ncbi:unnamed protein product [Gongylonema pulchrum]|uniref:PI3K/PI4K domain-containing protein n=1 Tax=Gongylonema pulchrum TaxID=637853 RepID=A0A183EF12_9BILA|nr:unnamed protein product [Gongylonema pulchrum]
MSVPKSERQLLMMEMAKKLNLECTEEIANRSSPALFPENVPGAWDLNKTLSTVVGSSMPTRFRTDLDPQDVRLTVVGSSMPTRFRTDLDPQDVRLVNELGQLSADQLMEHVKNLQNMAYLLGCEEGYFFAIFCT